MKFNRFIALLIVMVMLLSAVSGCQIKNPDEPNSDMNKDDASSLVLHYSLDEPTGSLARESVTGKDYKINYVFNEENADNLFKEPNDPLRRTGVKGNALYMSLLVRNIFVTCVVGCYEY